MSSNNFHYGNSSNFQSKEPGSHHDGPRRFHRSTKERSQSPIMRRHSRSPERPAPREVRRSRSRDYEGATRPLRTQDRPSNFSARRSPSPRNRERINLDIKVFIKQKFLDQGLCSFSALDQIVRQSGCEDIMFDEQIAVPDLHGKILIIKSKSLDKKAEAFISLMRILQD